MKQHAEAVVPPVEPGGRARAATGLTSAPLVVWLIGASLALTLATGMGADATAAAFNTSFGRTLGEFAIILLPAFVLAACLGNLKVKAASSAAVAASPFAAAAMVCPDTAYVALAPVASGRKLSAAFGSYAGFKLLFPAGPLIVASGMGVAEPALLLWGVALLVPVWIAGEL